MKSLFNLYQWALEYVRDGGRNDDYLDYFWNLPDPFQLTDSAFYAELAWCVYNAGIAERIVRVKWPWLKAAFRNFDPVAIFVAGREPCVNDAVAVIRHSAKAEAVYAGGIKILEDGPINERLAKMSSEEALAYFQTYSFIGAVTRYHLARNVGLDCVKPDRHLVRLAGYLGYSSPDELVSEIAAKTGERVGVIDFVLWRWLAWIGSGPGDLEAAVRKTGWC